MPPPSRKKLTGKNPQAIMPPENCLLGKSLPPQNSPHPRPRRLCKSVKQAGTNNKLERHSFKFLKSFHPVLKGHCGVFAVNFKDISRITLVFPLLASVGILHLWHLNTFLINI